MDPVKGMLDRFETSTGPVNHNGSHEWSDDESLDERELIVESERESSSLTMTSSSSQSTVTETIFQRAKDYVRPSLLFRVATYLYMNRSTLLVLAVHLLATMTVWGNFAAARYTQRVPTIEEGSSYYSWRTILPPIVFGSKHAILLQMSLLPLTMCRFTITILSKTILDRFVPFAKITFLHVYIAYWMIGLVLFATTGLVGFYGKLCLDGEVEYCNRLYSEIMVTGYAITFGCVVVGTTSYFRAYIPYEIFYLAHQSILILYAVTILHTFDYIHRKGVSQRSQSFVWVSASLVFYICDRLYSRFHRRYSVKLYCHSCVAGFEGESQKMVILRLWRPTLMHFSAGQYAFLQLDEIDNHWHPFSYASGPDSKYLEFYIQVHTNDSWTSKLFDLLKENKSGHVPLRFSVMGPYGTALASTTGFTHAICIGSGTGIVPMISLLKTHVHRLLLLEPERHMQATEAIQKRVNKLLRASRHKKIPLAHQITRLFFDFPRRVADDSRDVLRKSIHDSFQRSANFCLTRDFEPHQSAEMGQVSEEQHSEGFFTSPKVIKRQYNQLARLSSRANMSIYGVILLSFATVVGTSIIFFAATWGRVKDFLDPLTLLIFCFYVLAYQLVYGFVALFLWNGGEFLAFVDLALLLSLPLLDAYWIHHLHAHDTIKFPSFLVAHGYMTYRCWHSTIRARHCSIREQARQFCDDVYSLEGLEFLWVSRSASLVSELLPELIKVWEELAEKWGPQRASEVCSIQVYVTDTDAEAIASLKAQIEESGVPETWIQFCRPDFQTILEQHSARLIGCRNSTHSLLAFCGSTQLSSLLQTLKIRNDTIVTLTGHQERFQMTFVEESYG